jgi:hypothetical protein
MVEAVSRRPLTAEDRFRSQVSPCDIHDGRSGTGAGFSLLVLRFSPASIMPPTRCTYPHLHVVLTGRTNGQRLPSKNQCCEGNKGAFDRNVLSLSVVIVAETWLRRLVACVQLFACIPGQSMRDLWWAKWHWDMFFSAYLNFAPSGLFHQCSALIRPLLILYKLSIWEHNWMEHIKRINEEMCGLLGRKHS